MGEGNTMHAKTQDPEPSLEIAEAMVEQFENYLVKDALYRQLIVQTSAGEQMPKMSAGSLLETLADLKYANEKGELTRGQADRLADLADTVEQLARHYASAYREKLAHELKSQIDSWRWFLQDCREDRSRCRDEYRFEVRLRNRIALLLDALGERAPADQVSRLEQLDRDLRAIILPGEFTLDPSLQDRYPRDRYWWLYGKP
jgi:hypothetical protein